ncbi:glycosyltransferase family 4 protein [Polaromonas sp.]|uniref:glycosyltransferase family 4 protein n=1 Tax=Polaromonas sp. TaxID=1869339 RepID=UPI001848C11B|nr:glycosyltransferase family 4 protein [Polaromonas sp.]NMM05995.1 glycosyltransferase family 4 protein [Polaromonas sp.]
MRMLFIGPLPEPVTGQSLACQIFLDELSKKYTVDVINLSKRDFSSGIDSLGRIGEVLAYIWQARRKSRMADCIYFTISQSISGNFKDILIYLACFDKLPRMAVHLHGGAGMRELFKPSNRILRALNRFFFGRIGAVIVLGARHVDIFEGIAPVDRIHVVPNFAVDPLFVDEATICLKFDRVAPLRLLFLSNLISGKGYIEMVEAYKSLDSNTREQVQIDFAGGFQSQEKKNEFLSSIDGISQLRYHGIVGGVRKLELFRDAHLFCLPTYYPYEGQPISILEAYASGCAVMTTDHSGILDVFANGRNGYCVEKRSPDSIRQAIERAVAEPAALCRMALNNRAEADELYRTDRYNARLVHIVEQLK